ncbi:hypothetical protein [Streptomyces monashensis]|uniref:hypothetical protein n=1 Tax=Streptomyces monashensis TaxID=1678012 RepID=UPI001160979A|nr:hypothetical protein [Streptomyces monashensis]
MTPVPDAMTVLSYAPMFAYWPAPELRSRLTFCRRIDLARSAGTDFEQLVLTIRLALAARVGRPLPAFDPALRRLRPESFGSGALAVSGGAGSGTRERQHDPMVDGIVLDR